MSKIKRKASVVRDRCVVAIDLESHRVLRTLCSAHALKPNIVLARIISDWAQEYTKKHGFGVLDKKEKAS